jgi:hypothetical protein
MAYRGRARTVEGVDLAGLERPLDSVERLVPAWSRPPWADAWEDAWVQGVSGRRMRGCVVCPVRHGKTYTFATMAAWALAQHPELTIAYLTYSQKLSDRFSRVIRNYAVAAGVTLAPDHNRIEEWRTVEGGGLLASAVGGPITGFGANIIVCDDTIKGREEAESETVRDKTWDWITDDVYTRLEPSASMFFLGSRWHEDDPIGRVLRGDLRGDAWSLIHYRAISEDERGRERALWEERFPLTELQRRRAAFGGPDSRTWLSLYQGEPRPNEGALFRGAVYEDDFPEFA